MKTSKILIGYVSWVAAFLCSSLLTSCTGGGGLVYTLAGIWIFMMVSLIVIWAKIKKLERRQFIKRGGLYAPRYDLTRRPRSRSNKI